MNATPVCRAEHDRATALVGLSSATIGFDPGRIEIDHLLRRLQAAARPEEAISGLDMKGGSRRIKGDCVLLPDFVAGIVGGFENEGARQLVVA